MLAKAAVLFAGRNPTRPKRRAVMNGGAPVLRQTIRSYMTGPAFDRFLDEAGDTQFLTRGVTVFGNNMGLNATDLPSAARRHQQHQPGRRRAQPLPDCDACASRSS